eukprot:TRINITY_DN8331_c0_g1_i14.p1 TRINITY_DN8331_c0_g1~~TRINITY_DN8331_c0_g1_i14.p1  ORF type:complete len:270 (-),score=47.47 TRINITY_DN8331_c0_g1_i14:98-907(-)
MDDKRISELDFESRLLFTQEEKKLKVDHEQYLRNHPELNNIMVDFMNECLIQRPDNVYKFARDYFGTFVKATHSFSPLVVAGPSGVGKGTLIDKLFHEFPDTFGFSVSHTSRQPRKGEVNGFHYHFVTPEEFKSMIDANTFIEHAIVHGNYYGTSKKAVEEVMSLGKVCILDVDIQGAQSFKKSSLKCKYIFLAPPSLEELERRLIQRGTDTVESIAIRMHTTKGELEFAQKHSEFFDHVLVNEDFELTYAKLKEILRDSIVRRAEALK